MERSPRHPGIDAYGRTIAGSSIEVRGSGCRIAPVVEAEYQPFVRPPGGPVDLSVEVRCGGGPRTPKTAPLFRTDAWAMWPLADEGFQLSLLRVSEEERATVVSDRTTSRVVYHEAPIRAPVVAGAPLVPDPLRMPVEQMLLVQHLAFRGGAILHAAGIDFGASAVAFLGASGAGKSTLTGILLEEFPEAVGLSDERIVVRSGEGGFRAWGTPWTGTAQVARNSAAPLRALAFLRQHPSHGMSALSPQEAVRRLFAAAACPFYDPVRSGLVLETLERLVLTVPAFELRFARDAGVGAVVHDLLRSEPRAA
jgi:hypothetical protein